HLEKILFCRLSALFCLMEALRWGYLFLFILLLISLAVCDPPCQNKGSCSRPQLCICRSGFRGSRCEEVIPEEEYHPPGLATAFQPPAGSLPKRINSAQKREPRLPIIQKLPAGSLVTSQSYTGTSRTVRRYPAVNHDHLTSNILPNGNGFEQSSTGPQMVYQEPVLSPWGADLTEKIRKIKIVFTPTICKQTCHNGHCYNNCEKGDTTTLYSQSGHDHDPKSGFRIYFCQIPCLNGGRCVGRDECWCPSNSTGKFCHLPALKAERKQIPNSLASSSVKHSMYTLPLSNQLASIYPSLVNVHINHPPEATVQIHQVARVKSDSEQSEENSVENLQIPQFPVASHYNNNTTPNNNVESNQQQRSQGFLGKCYLETVHGKCADPLPGLARYEDCCGSVGAFWGLSRCIPCPVKPAYPTIENGHVECPQGYKNLNQSHCQDINECTIQGICKNAECMNTRGSFICTCKAGTMLDPSRSHCISDKAVSTEQGSCYRSVIRGMCTLPLNQRITKQICCCSRVGQGWGRNCEICPLLGSETFKEICPAGHGYTYANSDIRMSLRKAEVDELPSLSSQEQRGPGPGDQISNWTIRQKEEQEVLKGGVIDIFPPTDIPARKGNTWTFYLFPDNIFCFSFLEINPCSSSPDMCGPGTCVNFPEGYTCLCHTGYQQHPSHTYCIDIDECERNPCDGKGHCVNTEGSYSCICFSGYSILTSQNMQTCQDLNECDQPDVCHGGQCINIPGSYHCECKIGYFLNHKGQCEGEFAKDLCFLKCSPFIFCLKCEGFLMFCCCSAKFSDINSKFSSLFVLFLIDIDECTTYNICPRERCINTEGSFSCVACGNGYITSMDGRTCEDIDECNSHMACPQGICINTPGSFTCQTCEIGYVVSSNRQSCEDSNECEYPNIYCLGGECLNTPGSYTCHCQLGFELFNGTTCEDQNECLDSSICSPNGECLNSHGSYFCICALGFSNAAGGVSCQDVDECADQSRCLHGQCINTEGSYSCLCQTGFQHSQETDDCVDMDECEEFGATACGIWQCQNTLGSFHCIMGCPPGFHRTPFGECIDIDECANETLCGSHGFCDNTVGSFHCLCDRGYTNSPSNHDCIDVNECELMIAVCGTALCENVEGAFLCLCPSDHEEYDTETGECRPRSGIGESGRPVSLHPDNTERKECYYHISDVPLCDSVLANNTTKEECCCTEGAAWGDNCETYLCPVIGSVEYIDICPSGKGYIPVEGTLIFGQTSYTDANECEMFGSEICHNGHCVNTVPGYTCFCHVGYFYHSSQFACVDLDECENEDICANGKCLNTAGSYHCFCSLPLVLDVIHNHCVNISNSADNPDGPDSELEICWQKVSTSYVCSEPLLGRQTTYSECCCHYGEAWSRDCALCPPRSSDDFYQLCNIVNEAGLQERPSYEYGSNQDSHQYELYIPDLEPYLNRLDEDGAADTNRDENNTSEDSDYFGIFPSTRLSYSILFFFNIYSLLSHLSEQYSSFEGLQGEQCGILSGCENGRCVRVQEGYTCDCFDGFQLDLKLMACVDINECEAANASMILCKGNACENTEGSYRCACSPGSAALVESHCIPETAQNPEAA
uniref:Latent-transforming growth factor beta-binding protein 2 n=1 Tax=Naja naja TaxID=35670 RepID=A0A8C6YC68_NAJNA